ncbi:thiamin pyrophosphokinase 1-like isoform X1 [Pomacea canaliculata]|uniref:thiamin pyrophosphokinase 1-like isoform X1 n=1 Tax=Pomacea canaliculata TaxID=400727 RepID=UPI000D73D53E|nr:thiamin pyrophosphokinase 1-like isoform X1 [Pomacea canaliculata]
MRNGNCVRSSKDLEIEESVGNEVQETEGEMRVLKPLSCLIPGAVKNVCLIILNRPLERSLVKHVWSCSLFKAVSDGAADKLLECMEDENEKFTPDLISGDFDSATKSVIDYYKQKSVKIIETPDQDETDFTKCLRIAIKETKSKEEVGQYVVIGCIGGRLDHQFANIETLYTALSLTTKPVFLISEGSAACLLRPGKTLIEVSTGLEDDWCGLIPVGQRCAHVSTTGLKWNLKDQALGFGELVSTSNTYTDDQVTVETDHPLLWTMGYRLK